MKRKLISAILFLAMTSVVFVSCKKDDTPANDDDSTPMDPIEPEVGLLGDFWFGFYQEDAVTNPEDPLPGFIYVNIPNNGTFDGELFFSYSGCVGGVDVGRASGSASDGSLEGTWQGTVDGIGVGGEYTGQLNSDQHIEGAYNNAGGKVEIECADGSSYFVAPRGSIFLQNTNSNQALNIQVEPESNPLNLNWNGVTGSGIVYYAVFVDAECLEQKVNIRDCLMWSGISSADSMVYGVGITDEVPVEPLVSGNSYLVSITAVNDQGVALASSNITFVYQ